MTDSLFLEVADLDVDVLTGIYSQETHKPQPLRITMRVELAMEPHYAPDTPLAASKNYMDLRAAAMDLPEGVHFTLIEAVADHIITRLMAEDERVLSVELKIIKMASAEAGEAIGITMKRAR